MLNLLFVDSALELVPKSIWKQPSVVKRAKSLGKEPGDMLLDRTYHHQAMLLLENNGQRGRPDILHFSLLEALGSPLNKEGLLKIHVHTSSNHIISINPQVRLPRNYTRFVGLFEQLYKETRVPRNGLPLLKMSKGSIKSILFEIQPSYIMVFTRQGDPKTLECAMKVLSRKDNPVAIVGAFPRGHFTEETLKLADSLISIDPDMLEAWTVTSRLVYEFEKQVKLPVRRWENKHIEVGGG